jgi:uncharacterized membrane protein YphA (DoxX/SURF4 family)
MNQIITGLSLITFALVLFIICPFALIWAINTLFATHIAYNFVNWLAASVLYYSFAGAGKFSSSEKGK